MLVHFRACACRWRASVVQGCPRLARWCIASALSAASWNSRHDAPNQPRRQRHVLQPRRGFGRTFGARSSQPARTHGCQGRLRTRAVRHLRRARQWGIHAKLCPARDRVRRKGDRTVEGLRSPERPGPVQHALIDTGAAPCGYW